MVDKILISDGEFLKKAIDKFGLPIVLTAVFGKNFRVQIPISNNLMNSALIVLNLSCRSNNALMRGSIHTISDLISIIETNKIADIRNLGKKSEKEIKTKLIMAAYNALTMSEQVSFCENLLELNR